MQIEVKLQASLRKFAPPGADSEFAIDLPGGSTIQGVFDLLKIDAKYRPVIFLNGDTATSREVVLHEGDRVHLMPAMAGGA